MEKAETSTSNAAGSQAKAEQSGMPKPHRCNDRVEDWVQAFYTLEWKAKISPTWRNMRACFASEVGQEPTMPYVIIKDGQQFLEYRKRKDPPYNFRAFGTHLPSNKVEGPVLNFCPDEEEDLCSTSFQCRKCPLHLLREP